MKLLVTTIGAPGSGKNRLLNKIQSYFQNAFTVVEPDDIRRTVFGSVNEQSQGDKVFEIAEQRIKSALENSPVFFNATNVSWGRLKESLIEYGADQNVLIFMQDSLYPELCKERIKKDLDNKVDRSNVPDDVVDRFHTRFIQCQKDALNDHSDNIKLIFYQDNFAQVIRVIEEYID